MEFRAIVAHPWEAEDPAELSVNIGQILVVQSVNDRGWALVIDEATGTSGWVPNDYLQPLESQEVIEEIPIEIQQPAFLEVSQPVVPSQPQPPQPQISDIHNAMNSLSLAVQQQQQPPTPQQPQPPQPTSAQQPAAEPASICQACQKGIDGSALIAKGKHFHQNCFVCSVCQQVLSNGFLERDGQFFCENDYYRSQGFVCAHCNEVIVGPHIIGDGKPFHVDHLLCADCGVSIGTDVLHVKDGNNICHNCYTSKHATTCEKCKNPIEVEIFTALGKNYHRECFVCTEGDHVMPDDSFHVHEDKIYCPEHYRKLFSKTCQGCQGEITGQYLQVLDFYFHPQCWKCKMCEASLEQTGCAKKNEQFYCPSCVVKVPTELTPTQPPAAAAAAAQPAPAKPAAAAPPTAKAPTAPSNAGPLKTPAPAPTKPAATAPVNKSVAAPAPAPVSKPAVSLAPSKQTSDENITQEELCRRLIETSNNALAQSNALDTVQVLPEQDNYSLEDLRNNATLPASVVRSKKESYLTDEEFQSTFKMTKEQFYALKNWKQQELKKNAKLF